MTNPIDPTGARPTTSGARRWALATAAIAGAFLAGVLTVGTVTAATAQDDQSTTQTEPDAADCAGPGQRPDEQPLTGEDADKATAAALAKYPGATVQRVETDADGVYEVHLTTADGQRVTVELDADFNVTGEEAGRR